MAQGFCATRAEFIRVAIRDQFASRADVVREATARRSMVIGAVACDRRAIEQLQKAGQRLSLRAVGLLVISADVPPGPARQTIEPITVHGVCKASDAVEKAPADRRTSQQVWRGRL